MTKTTPATLPLDPDADRASRSLASGTVSASLADGPFHIRDTPGQDAESSAGSPAAQRPRERADLAGEMVVVLLAAALLCAAYASVAWYGFDLLEEGYFLVHARRVQLGGLPYRDFSTPYTPGIFYLYAWLMEWVGADLVGFRLIQIVARAVTFVGLYAAARRLMAPGFAALASAVLVVMDTAPEMWGIHPGWITAGAATMGVLIVSWYLATGQGRWLLAAGAAFGIAFAFKQNLAAYGLIAALWFLVVAERDLPPVWTPRPLPQLPLRPRSSALLTRAARVAVQVAALVLLPLTAAAIVRPYLSPLVATLYVLPLAALSVLGATHFIYRTHPDTIAGGGTSVIPMAGGHGLYLGRDAGLAARPLLVLLGFSAVTLTWIVPLLGALDGRVDLLGGFVGRIDPTGYFYGMKPLTTEHARLVGVALLPPLILVAIARTGLWGRRGVALLLAALLALVLGALLKGPATAPSTEPWSVLGALQRLALSAGDAWDGFGQTARPTDDLILYLPVLAFWAGMASLALTVGAGGERTALQLWYLAAGAALFLNQYPRMDEIHLLWSAGVLLVAGADVLHELYRRAVRSTPALGQSGAARALLGLALVLLPAVAISPRLWQRLDDWSRFSPAPPAEVHAAGRGARVARSPLTLPGGGQVWLPEGEGMAIGEVVDLLQIKTAPGEPIFAYPAVPGFAYLADRPSATRFLHLFAGMATADEQAEMVRQLEGVRYVVWDDGGAHYWVRPGDNAPLTEYIRTHFRIERFIGPYAVLARDARGPQLAYTLPGATMPGASGP